MSLVASKSRVMNGLWITFTLAIGSGGMLASADEFVIQGATAGKEAGAPAPGVSASISWEELKDRCLHPEQFDVQRPPQNIKLQCSETRLEFVPTPAGQIAIAGSRSIMTTLLSDKFHAVAGTADLPVQGKPAACLRYKEVEKILTLERPMSCQEILSVKGDLTEYCTSALDRARGSQPKLMQGRDTGRILDTCSASISGGSSGGEGSSGGSGSSGGAQNP